MKIPGLGFRKAGMAAAAFVAVLIAGGALASQQNPANSPPKQAKSNPTAAAKATEQPLHPQNLPVKPNIAASSIPMATEVLSMIHQTDQVEIQAGRMAQSHSNKFQVRELGGLLIRDHTLADQMVTNFAKVNHIALIPPQAQGAPQEQQNAANQTPPVNLTPAQGRRRQISAKAMQQQMQAATATMQQLDSLHGEEFDQKFLPFIQQGHQNTIAMLSAADVNLPPSQLKNMLNKMIPILTQHYEIASRLNIRQASKGLGGGE